MSKEDKKHSDISAEAESLTKNIWLPELGDIWDALRNLDRLGNHTEIHRGMKYNFSIKGTEGRYRVVADQERPNFAKGLYHVSDSLELFVIRGHKYLNISPEDMKDKAYEWSWAKPKVIANAFRRSRGHWRITAAPDYEGLYCSQTFHGIWALGDIPLEVISAVLNGPIANAYISDFEITAKEIRVGTLRHIPIPDIGKIQRDRVVELVAAYRQNRKRWLDGILDGYSAHNVCAKLLRQIDGEILQSYGLSPKLEKKLLNYFTGHSRPAPVKFDGYYPKTFRLRMKGLQDRVHEIDWSQIGSPAERAKHHLEIMRGLENARKRANMNRIEEE